MANAKTNQPSETQQQNRSQTGRGGSESQMQRSSRQPSGALQRADNPFQVMRQISSEMDRMFDRFFGGLGYRGTPFGGFDLSRGPGSEVSWSPRVEAFQKDDKFIIRAELPGISREDVHVDINDDIVTIQGQRREEHKEEREGFYHSEWSYGSFSRAVPLPDGAIVDNADASFRDGVLTITVPAPPAGVRQGRRIEIQGR